MREFILNITKSGLPSLWESGGATTNNGSAIIIADMGGKKKKPLYIRTSGELSNLNHSLFVVEDGDIIVETKRSGSEGRTKGFRIANIDITNKIVLAEQIFEVDVFGNMDNFTIDGEYPHRVKDSIEASFKKSLVYHCRHPVYYKE